MTRPVRIGIVGCGVISATHADAIKQISGAQLTACCDIEFNRAICFGEIYNLLPQHVYSNLSEFLGDSIIDAVSVCTPSGTHAEIAIAALRAGKPVIVEKPMDVSHEAVSLLNSVQKETGLQLSVISQHRFDAASIYAHKLAVGGYLGQLVICEAQIKWYRSQEYYDSGDWRGTWALDGGGALMNQGIHTVDLMRWVMGPVRSVYGVAKTLAHTRIEVEDAICATLTFESGAIGNLVATTAAYPGFPAQLSFHGSTGSVVIAGDALTSVNLTGETPVGRELEDLLAEGVAGHAMHIAQGGTQYAERNKGLQLDPSSSTWGDAHRAQLTDFVESIVHGRAPKIDGIAGSQAVEIILAAYKSARTGESVHLL